MKKIVLLILFAMVLPKNVMGQYRLQNKEELDSFNSIPKEEVFIHFNDNLLLSGEYLYYKFYCLDSENKSPSDISKIGYVVLIGENDKLIFQHKIKLIDGRGQGDFFIPANIQSGHYKLIGFTQWMRNERRHSFFVEDMAIVNPYQELPKVTDELLSQEIVHSRLDSLINAPIPDKKMSFFQIRLSERTFGKRQLVKFDISEIGENGLSNLSISVRKKDSIKLPFQKKTSLSFEENSTSSKSSDLKLNDSIYLPELRGELISGRLISRISKLPVADKNISLSIIGMDGLSKISRSNKEGAFYFNLDAGSRNNKVVFDILEKNKEEIEIILDSRMISSNSFDFKEIDISSDLNAIFEQRSIYNQIENAFFEQKGDSIIRSANTQAAYRDFEETYNLDDYTRFKTLQETIVEIIEDVLVKKRKGQYIIQVRGNDEFFIDSNDAPLILVDNILVQNADNLFNYDVKKIQQIGISRNEFYIGPKKYQGIFSIETKDTDYPEQISSDSELNYTRHVPGPIPLKNYYLQDYSSTNSQSAEHIADFRQQLLWAPNITIDKTVPFEFYTSNNSGTYEISIEGFTENGGPVSLSEKIYVE